MLFFWKHMVWKAKNTYSHFDIKNKINFNNPRTAISSNVSSEQSGILWQMILWQMICKQTHIFSATSAQNYFARQFLGGCSVADSSWEPCIDRGSASSGLSSPFVCVLVPAFAEPESTPWLWEVYQHCTYFLRTVRKAVYSKYKCSWSIGIFS